VGVCGGLGFEVRVRRIGKAVFLVRCVLYPGSRVSGQYSHLGCWLAVEMVIDGRLRQGKALLKVGCEFGQAAWVDLPSQEKGKSAASPLPCSL